MLISIINIGSKFKVGGGMLGLPKHYVAILNTYIVLIVAKSMWAGRGTKFPIPMLMSMNK